MADFLSTLKMHPNYKQELTLGTALCIIYDVRFADLSTLSDDRLVKIHILHSVCLQVQYI